MIKFKKEHIFHCKVEFPMATVAMVESELL